MRLRLLATLVVFVWIPAARANTIVWFEAVPITPFTGVWSQGPGQTLQLEYDNSLSGTYSWQVSMKAALGTGGILGWSLDLRTAPGNNVSLLNPQIVPGPLSNSLSSPGVGGAGPSLLQGAGGYGFPPAPPQTVTLLTFTLRRTILSGEGSHAQVFGGPSINPNWVWFNETTSDYEVVQFGPNPPVPAMEGTIGAFQLIRLAPYVPEPSSLALLVLGGAVCLRRRRCVIHARH